MRSPAPGSATVLAALAVVLMMSPSHAQEFAAPAPAGERSFVALLERGLPPDSSGIEGAVLAIRWHGVPELDTRSVAVGAAWRRARMACGVSQAGDRDLGWNAAAIGVGMAEARAGAALRSCVRQRRAAAAPAEGVEIGAAAWLAASPRLDLWTSAPQLWTRGDPPPLERWLEIGGTARFGEVELWLARVAAPGRPKGLGAEHLAGVRTGSGALLIWIEARDRPLRGALGLATATRGLSVAATVESHPVMGETVRLALAWTRRGAR